VVAFDMEKAARNNNKSRSYRTPQEISGKIVTYCLKENEQKLVEITKHQFLME